MIVPEIWNWDLNNFREAFSKGDLSSEELTESFIQRTIELEPKIQTLLYFHEESVRTSSRLLQPKRSDAILHGIPIAIKDNICVRGIPCTCASRILEGFIPPYDATAIERLKKEHALIFAKTNLDEFAMGSSTENSAFQNTRNPWNRERVPGGSSGGSAAAVAAGLTFWALGSDTGGSVRQPASLCGVVGIKPTYGRVSRYGLVAFASSLDVIGVITRRVWDNAVILHTIAGADARDQTTAEVPLFSLNAIRNWESTQKTWRIGLPVEYFSSGLETETRSVLEKVFGVLENHGCEFVEIRLPHSEYAVAVYYVLCTSEVSSNLARYDGVRYGFRNTSTRFRDMYAQTRSQGFGDEVKRRIMLGTFALSAGYYDAYYLTGSKARTLIAQDFHQAFQKVDLIAGPTSPTTAWKLGEKLDDPLKMYLSDIYTVPSSLAGLPALSIPVGLDKQGLPVGLQIIGPHFGEDKIYQLAMKIEALFPFYREIPRGILS